MFYSQDSHVTSAAVRNNEIALKIFDLQLEGLTDQLNQQQITLDICPQVRRHLALSGFSPGGPTSRMKGVIRNQLRKPVYRMMLSGEVSPGATIRVHPDDEKDLKWEVIRLLKEELVIPEKRNQHAVNRFSEFNQVHL